MTQRHRTEDLVRDALRSTTADDTRHVDDANLAAFLDGVLEESARETVESHLAACFECRQFAAQAAQSLPAAKSEAADSNHDNVLTSHPSRWRRRSEAALALAAALVLGVGLVIFVQLFVSVPDLGKLGVTAAEFESAGSGVRRSARTALAASFGPVVGLPGPEALGGDTVLRGETDATAPLPLAPRWTAEQSERPELIWQAFPRADAFEVLLVDESEVLVAAFEVDGGSDRLAAALPDEIRLEAGALYFWKVNARRAEGVASSPWVPFRVLASAEVEAAGQQLAAAGGDPFLEASVLAAWGLDQAALDTLALVPAEESGRQIVTNFARSLLERHELPEPTIAAELTRSLGDG